MKTLKLLIKTSFFNKINDFIYSSLFTENGRNLRIIQLYQNKQHA